MSIATWWCATTGNLVLAGGWCPNVTVSDNTSSKCAVVSKIELWCSKRKGWGMRRKETWHVYNCGGNNTKRKLQDEEKRFCRYTQSYRVMHTFIYVIITCGSFCFCVSHLMGLRCAWWFKVHTLWCGVVVFLPTIVWLCGRVEVLFQGGEDPTSSVDKERDEHMTNHLGPQTHSRSRPVRAASGGSLAPEPPRATRILSQVTLSRTGFDTNICWSPI